MLKEQLAALYAVQQMDSALDALKKQYAALDKGETERTTYEAAKAAHQAADTGFKELEASQLDTELEQKTVEGKRAEFEKKLYGGTIRNPKELQAMQEEVEMLGRQRGRLDEKLLTVMDALEAARTRQANAKAAHIATRSALKAKLEAAQQDADRLSAQFKMLKEQREEGFKAVPPPLQKRYEMLRAAKGGVGLAAVEDGNACGGCKMGLPSTVVKRVHEGNEIVVCENCGRLLCEKEKS